MDEKLIELLSDLTEQYAKEKVKIDGASEALGFENIKKDCENNGDEKIQACVQDIEEIQAKFVTVGEAYEKTLKTMEKLKAQLKENEIFGSSQGKSLS